MTYIKDKTQFHHKKYGNGIYRGITEGGSILIEFKETGIKKFASDSIKKGHLVMLTEEPDTIPKEDEIKVIPPTFKMPPSIQQIGAVVQHDSSEIIIAERNILEAFHCEDTVLFNESYVIIGESTSARVIKATYDLTVIGDLSVDEISVNGSLTVLGDIDAGNIICSKKLFCSGNINTNSVYSGMDLIANSIKCSEFICDGNAVIRTTIDIDKSCRTEKTMVACEGIIGGGLFAAVNAIANEYFEFDGELYGHIVELAENRTLSELTDVAIVSNTSTASTNLSDLTIKECLEKINTRLQNEYSRISTLDEQELLDLTSILSANALSDLSNMGLLFEKLTEISYKDKIDDLGDYLLIKYAKAKLPYQLYQYETVEHVDSILLPQAEAELSEMDFIPSSIEKIAQSLHIITYMRDSFPVSPDILLDIIFSSFGIRYSTVARIIRWSRK